MYKTKKINLLNIVKFVNNYTLTQRTNFMTHSLLCNSITRILLHVNTGISEEGTLYVKITVNNIDLTAFRNLSVDHTNIIQM